MRTYSHKQRRECAAISSASNYQALRYVCRTFGVTVRNASDLALAYLLLDAILADQLLHIEFGTHFASITIGRGAESCAIDVMLTGKKQSMVYTYYTMWESALIIMRCSGLPREIAGMICQYGVWLSMTERFREMLTAAREMHDDDHCSEDSGSDDSDYDAVN